MLFCDITNGADFLQQGRRKQFKSVWPSRHGQYVGVPVIFIVRKVVFLVSYIVKNHIISQSNYYNILLINYNTYFKCARKGAMQHMNMNCHGHDKYYLWLAYMLTC